VVGSCEHSNERLGSIKGGEFLEVKLHTFSPSGLDTDVWLVYTPPKIIAPRIHWVGS
jgi:hypothetical protein